MSFWLTLLLLFLLSYTSYRYTKKRVLLLSGNESKNLAALPKFYGWSAILWLIVPFLLLTILFKIFNIHLISATIDNALLILFSLLLSITITAKYITPAFHARKHIEKWILSTLTTAATISIIVTALIILSVLVESLEFFQRVSVLDFLFGTNWSPQTALRTDQAGSSGSFGAIPVFIGTLLITLIALLTAVPLGIFSAVYIGEYASKKTRNIVKPILEILAGIPTVVYGYFAAITVAPFIRDLGGSIGLDIASESALTAGIVMGIMIIPFILSLSDDAINAVPQGLRDASLGIGSTKAETITKVVLPAALPGIISSIILATSRAVGETMIVVMAAGLAANMTLNPLESVTTVTVQIVTLLVGDQEFDSAKTLAAFALGLTLFIITLILNIVALRIVNKYKEQYQ